MSLPNEDKEMRVQHPSPIGYNTSLETHPEKPDPYPPKSYPRISYRECLKNHAANIGGHVTDGCGEFMPSGDDGTLDALKCAACTCHRNFHRRDSAAAVVHPLHLPSPSISHHRGGGHWVQPVKMAFGGGGTGSSSSEELNFDAYNSAAAAAPPQFASKKRFRTKFSTDQKGKMLEFAEKLGWRIPREDDTEVQRFCAEVGVKRQVFKVWMHNNKSTSSSKKTDAQEF